LKIPPISSRSTFEATETRNELTGLDLVKVAGCIAALYSAYYVRQCLFNCDTAAV